MNEALEKYSHKETWSRRGKDFNIEVTRWEYPSSDEPRYVWNVYCYIYPKHKLFGVPKDEGMGDCPINNLHCGCTFVRWHRDKDEVISKQYGSDYSHIWDEAMDKIKDPGDAYNVFNDAEDLFNELEERNK